MINLCVKRLAISAGEGREAQLKCCCGLADDLIILRSDKLIQMGSSSYSEVNSSPFPFDDIVTMHFCLMENAVVLVRLTGDIVLASFDRGISDFQTLGSFGCLIEAVSWSPDESLLIAISKDQIMTVLDSSFDMVVEIDLGTLAAPSEVPQNVGWGKKETQFTGAGAKKIIREANDDSIDIKQEYLSDGPCSISWRDKSDIFAVSYLDKSSAQRKLSVFDREGVHLCSSESTADTSPGNLIAFRPCGDLIASNGVSATGQCVVNFFERNCLKHGSFVVGRNENTSIYKMFYNPASDLLFVCTEELLPEPQHLEFHLKIYNRRNYHHYLVQSYFLPAKCVDHAHDPVKPYFLFILLADGSSMTFEWTFRSASFDQSSFIDMFAVIDGCKLLCTPFSDVLVPPPMSFYDVQLDQPIMSRCMFKNQLFIITQDEIFVYSCNGSELDPGVSNSNIAYGKTNVSYSRFPKFEQKYSLEAIREVTGGSFFFHWTVLDDNLLGCVAGSNQERSEQTIYILELEQSTRSLSVKLEHSVTSQTTIASMNTFSRTGNDDWNCIFASFDDGSILQLSEKCANAQPLPFTFPKSCSEIRPVFENGEINVFGFASCRYLYLNSRLICDEVTSFDLLGNHFLLYTTQSHRLFVVPFSQLFTEAGKLLDTTDWYSRKVERGCKIVGVTQSSTGVVLQMPRGNLELIHPKPLLVNVTEKKLEHKQFEDAFKICQKHRLDMNIICDHDFHSFLADVPAMLQKVRSHHLLNLFISELSDSQSALKFERKTPVPSKMKIEKVCSSLISAIEGSDQLMDVYILSLVMLYVKLKDPQSALRVVKKWGNIEDPNSPALDFLLLLVDVDKLFDLALGMYEKQLVLRVLEKSKKDPKEYLPLINNQLFKGSCQEEIQFNIDNYLGNYEKALRSLNKFNSSFEQVFKYVKTHSLYDSALTLFLPESSDPWKTAASEYAKILESTGKPKQAACLYAKMGSNLEALSCFCKAKSFDMALPYFYCLSPKTVADYFNLRESLVSGLESTGHVKEAAQIMSSYDEESALDILIRNHAFASSLEFVMRSKQREQLKLALNSSLQASLRELTQTVTDKVSEVKSLAVRLDEVIEKKRQWALLSLEDPEMGAYGDGTISEFSTVSKSSRRSNSSQSSTSSSKKLNRKKRSLKKNSPEEHLAILDEAKKIHAFVGSAVKSLKELLVAVSSVPGMTLNQSLFALVAANVDDLNSMMNKIWSQEALFQVKIDQFSDVVSNFEDSVVKPMSNADLILFVKPESLVTSFTSIN